MDEYPGTDGFFAATSVRDIADEFATSLGDREDRQMLVKTLRRRFPEEVHQANIVLIDCRAFRDPASSALRTIGEFIIDHALQDSESSQISRFVDN